MSQDTVKTLSKGIVLKSLSNQLVMLAGLAISVLLNRHYGKENYGLVVLTYTIVGFITSLSSFGVKPAINRFLPQYMKLNNFKSCASIILVSFFYQIIGLIIFSLLIFFLSNFISITIYHKAELRQFLIAAIAYMIGLSLSDYVFQVFQGLQDWKKDAFANILYNCSYLIFIIVIIYWLKLPIVTIFYANLFAALITFFVGISITQKTISRYFTQIPKKSVLLAQSKKIFGFSLPLTISPVTLFLSTWFDKAILGKYIPLGELSLYYIAFLFYNALLTFLKTFNTVLLPYLASISNSLDTEIKRKFQVIFRFFMHVSILCCIISFFAVKPVIVFLYGNAYLEAVLIFRFFLALLFIRSFGNTLGMFSFNVFGMTYQLALSGIVLTVLTIALNILLVPSLGYRGAILGNFIAFSIFLIVYLVLMKPVARLISLNSVMRLLSIIAVISGAYMVLRYFDVRNEFILFTVLIGMYAVMLKVLTELHRSDLDIIKKFFLSARDLVFIRSRPARQAEMNNGRSV